MIKIDVRADLKKLQRSLNDLANKQIPYASALALTETAKKVQAEETRAIAGLFDNPTPFTLRSIGVVPATKGRMQAVVFMRDIAASYLAPYEFGGAHALGAKKGLLVPKDVPVNQYGNLTRNKLKQLKARADVFIGAVTLKNGQTINGVWQRPSVGKRRDGTKGSKGNTHTGLKLLIRFEDPLPVKQRLGYHDRARQVVSRSLTVEFGKAFAKAMATAR